MTDSKSTGFLDSCKVKFGDVSLDNGETPMRFLDAAEEIIALLDILGSTAFAPVKSDVGGNIKRLRTRYESNPSAFPTLQKMVDAEIKEKKQTDSKSCALGILWLKRALEFVQTFLAEVVAGEPDLTVCATKAYEKTLRQYHNFIVRGIFSVAVRAVPHRKDFLRLIGGEQRSEAEVVEELKRYAEGMGSHLQVLDSYCSSNKIQ